MSANSKLWEQLIALNRQNFTGILIINSHDGKQWQLYFYLGKFLWCMGGVHINRSWKRHLTKYCPQVDISSLILRYEENLASRNYYLINVLLQRKIITKNQIKNLIESRTREIFFDLLQEEYKHSLGYLLQPKSAHYLLKVGFSLSLAFINLEQMLFQAQQSWSTWGSKGLASCSPNLAPLLQNHQQLKNQVPNIILNNMSRLLNGKNSFRDLALTMDKDVFELACGIVPYFFKGYLRLLEIPDIADINSATYSSVIRNY
ncbi:MAG: DUF4388 domain-containing protein [Pleurocapsa sp.]